MATSIPGAIAQFMVIAQDALPDGFLVQEGTIFGPYQGQGSPQQALLVADVDITMDTWAELGPTYRHEEHYNIECYLCSAAGNNDQASRLTETYNLYVDIQEAVANNPTLNGTVRVSACRQLKYSPTYDSKGMSVGQLNFEVYCEQRVTSLPD